MSLTLPYFDYPPTSSFKVLSLASIAGYIGCKLLLPKLCPRFWRRRKAAFVAMPEAAMHKNHGLVTRKYDVGRSREFTHMKFEPQSNAVGCRAHRLFGAGVLAPDTSHHSGPDFSAYNIHITTELFG